MGTRVAAQVTGPPQCCGPEYLTGFFFFLYHLPLSTITSAFTVMTYMFLQVWVVLTYTAVIKIGEKWNASRDFEADKVDILSLVHAQPFYQSRCLGHLVVRADMLALCFTPNAGSSLETGDWTCPVCLDILANPVVLDCSHRFCWGCITKAIEKNPCCPVCRKHQSSTVGAQGLQVDVSLSKFLAHHIPSVVGQVCTNEMELWQL